MCCDGLDFKRIRVKWVPPSFGHPSSPLGFFLITAQNESLVPHKFEITHDLRVLSLKFLRLTPRYLLNFNNTSNINLRQSIICRKKYCTFKIIKWYLILQDDLHLKAEPLGPQPPRPYLASTESACLESFLLSRPTRWHSCKYKLGSPKICWH